MPRPVLQVVAAVLVAICVGAFALGVATAPSRGKLPGERATGVTSQVIQAQDATPLTDERIEGPPPPPEVSDEEKARLAEEKEAKEAAAIAKAEAAGVMPVAPATSAAPPAAVEAPAAATPPPPPPKVEEPVF
ncbi:hypothetical protein [uncultured Phenylobacterium sp.]|uniref:hypothetical protein n=1 Tax=uncultured Phenylobacterium sp. TaxID=349273 RepID=UPI0025D09B52|nr:hypothetical protein [uncultured Phenylobacterium sp.]